MAHLIHIGNSLGVRIPKAIIMQVGFKSDTPLQFKITEEGLLISPTHQTRKGWKDAFESSPKNPLLIGNDIVNQFDQEEWEW